MLSTRSSLSLCAGTQEYAPKPGTARSSTIVAASITNRRGGPVQRVILSLSPSPSPGDNTSCQPSRQQISRNEGRRVIVQRSEHSRILATVRWTWNGLLRRPACSPVHRGPDRHHPRQPGRTTMTSHLVEVPGSPRTHRALPRVDAGRPPRPTAVTRCVSRAAVGPWLEMMADT